MPSGSNLLRQKHWEGANYWDETQDDDDALITPRGNDSLEVRLFCRGGGELYLHLSRTVTTWAAGVTVQGGRFCCSSALPRRAGGCPERLQSPEGSGGWGSVSITSRWRSRWPPGDHAALPNAPYCWWHPGKGPALPLHPRGQLRA